MSVLLVNGSPNAHGCTYTALCEVAKALNNNGITTEIFQVGKKINPCIGCRACAKTKTCFHDDIANKFVKLVPKYDGFVFGTPVHFASSSSTMKSFMDRVFFNKFDLYEGKPAASVVSCRRAGSTSTFDMMNKYFTICNMPVVSSQYWNQVHGYTGEDVERDLEGMQTMRTLGNNMSWLIKCIKIGKANGIFYPKSVEEKIHTHFMPPK